MLKFISAVLCFTVFCSIPVNAKVSFEKDIIKTAAGNLEITFIGHGTLMFGFNGKIIHIDPFSELADYSKFPKADIIILTHDHRDHFDLKALKHLRVDKTTVVLTETCAQKLEGGIVMKNGDTRTVDGITIKAVPAYNLIHKRANGKPFHPKGIGNGYIFTFGDKQVYIAGDTENTPEMKALKGIDYAFLPMNLPYTMTPEMVADAVKAFKPKVIYPYHYGDTDTSRLAELLKDIDNVELRIRRMR